MYYVYAHYTLDTNECFYIGVGKNKRAWDKGRNKYWTHIVDKHGYRIEIVSEFDTRNRAERIEHMLQNLIQPRACLSYGDCQHGMIGNTYGLDYSHTSEAKNKIKIAQYKPVTNCRGEVFESMQAATEHYSLHIASISQNLNGKGRSAGKYSDGSKIRWKRL